MNINQYLRSDGLFVEAFKPLKEILNEDAQACWKEKTFSRWVICPGKGGSEFPQYIDISLYRHCMDVSVFAFFLFLYTWQAKKLPSLESKEKYLEPDDEESAIVALRQLLVIAFLHDANKYYEEDNGSPTPKQVERLYQEIKAQQWTTLTPKDCYTGVSLIEDIEDREFDPEAPKIPSLLKELSKMVREGDKLTAIASREGGHSLNVLLKTFVETYNTLFLEPFSQNYYISNLPLRLFEFRQSPVILQRLAQLFLTKLYKEQQFPLACLLNGERFYISLQAESAIEMVESVLNDLQRRLSYSHPCITRKNTSGEVTLSDIHHASTLIEELTKKPHYALMTVDSADWETVNNYIKSWTADVGGLIVCDKPNTGTLWLAIKPLQKAWKIAKNLPLHYLDALCIACVLRAKRDEKGKTLGTLFKERLTRLQERYPRIQTSLTEAPNNFTIDNLGKNTQQTLFALQTATEIAEQRESVLEELITWLYGGFPTESAENAGAQAIVTDLKMQQGLTTNENDIPVYDAMPKGGTCLLCGTPTTKILTDEVRKIATLKSSAFNNRIGQRKSIWTQSEHNYLCPACEKQQNLLSDVFLEQGKKNSSEPLLIATPFRGLIKPLKIGAAGEGRRNMTDFLTMPCGEENWNKWKTILPWNLDTSGSLPLLLESTEFDFKSTLSTMYCLAKVAAYSGNPIHVFISAQRESKSAFIFEQTPPLIKTLLEKSEESKKWALQPGVVHRDNLPQLINRLWLFTEILKAGKMLNLNNGHDVLNAILTYGWWALAWLNKRFVEKEKGKINFSDKVLLAREKEYYPMTEPTSDLKDIAELAAQVQFFSNWNNNNERTFALTVVLEQLEKGKRFQGNKSSEAARLETVAAMASTLGRALRRRNRARITDNKAASFYPRCKEFAEKVYDFVENHVSSYGMEANFQRYLLAAYDFLFV
jgi:hypothetical protein